MTLPTSVNPYLGQALVQVLGLAAGLKTQAQDAIAQTNAGPVDTAWVFSAVDIMRNAYFTLERFKNVAGLNAYATAQVPGYVGTLTDDILATQNALQNCVNWIVTNFPKDSTNSFILAETLNSDGTRTMRSFTTAQMAGFRTVLTALIATIG